MKVDRWDRTRDGEPTESALRRKLEAEGYTVERWVYSPGTRFPMHTHDVDKKDAVVSGRFRLTMQGTSSCSRPATRPRSRAASRTRRRSSVASRS